MTESDSSHDDKTHVIPDGALPSAPSGPMDRTVPGTPKGSSNTGKTDIFDQVEADDDPYVGKTLGNYHILSRLGQGGFGTVYKARDVKLDRHVAVKFLTAPMNSDYSKLFEREAKILANLSKNSNIVQIYTWGEYKGTNYMVLEYMDQSVETLLGMHPNGLPLKDALEIIAKCCEALEYAHDEGVLHRDIKPANILMDAKTKQTKVCDFGLARFYNKGIDSATQTIAGSPPFMPVEQITGKSLDERSDVYSLGVTLYQLLSGKLPFNGDSQYEIMEKIRSTQGTPLPTYRDGLPKIVYDIVKKAKSQKPDDRFQSASEFHAAVMLAIRAIEETGSADSARLAPSKPSWMKYAVAAGIAAAISIVGVTVFQSGSGDITAPAGVLAVTKGYIDSGNYADAEAKLNEQLALNANDNEALYQLSYAFQRSGQFDKAQEYAAKISDPKLKREIDAVLAHEIDGGQSRSMLEANAAEGQDAYSQVLLGILDLAEKKNNEVIVRLEGFDTSSLYFEWQKHRVLQTLGQAYLAENQFDKATAAFDQLRGVPDSLVAGRADEFAEIIQRRMDNDQKAAFDARIKEVSQSISESGDFDNWTSRPFRIRVLDPEIQDNALARVQEEELGSFFADRLDYALSKGDGAPITIINSDVMDEIVTEQNTVALLGDDSQGFKLGGLLGVRFFVTPEFGSYKGEQYIRFNAISVETRTETPIEDQTLPPRGSDLNTWKTWINDLQALIRNELSAAYSLQGMLSREGDRFILNIGSAVGVTEGMEFTLQSSPDTMVLQGYSVKVASAAEIGENQCYVEISGFSPETVPADGWFAKQKAQS